MGLREELIELELASSIRWVKDVADPDDYGCNTIFMHSNEEAAEKVLAWLKEKGIEVD